MIVEGQITETFIRNLVDALTEITGEKPQVLQEPKGSGSSLRPDLTMEMRQDGKTYRIYRHPRGARQYHSCP